MADIITLNQPSSHSNHSPALKVLVLSEGNQGHTQQSLGIVRILKSRISVEVRQLDVHTYLRGFARPAVYWGLNHTRTIWPSWVSRHISSIPPLDGFQPDLILSSGGRSMFANIMLSRETGCPNLYVSELGGVDPACFTGVVSLDQTQTAKNHLLLEVLPTAISPAVIDQAARGDLKGESSSSPPMWCLMIGGSSRSHQYRERDWHSLCQGINHLASRYGIQWLISTSPRTGLAAESVIEQQVDAHHVREIVLQSRDKRRVVAPFLGMAERIFVTQDSLTMLSEAISSCKPAYALSPERVALPVRCDFHRFLEHHTGQGRLIRCPLVNLSELKVYHPFSLLDSNYFESMADRLLKAIGRTVTCPQQAKAA